MSDDLVAVLLRAEADRLSVGVTPPPLDRLPARRPRPMLPVAAAAAVVLAAGVAFGASQALHEETGPVPITNVGAVVPFDKDEPTVKFGDVPAPEQVLPRGYRSRPTGPPPYANDGNALCAAGDVDASLDLAKGTDAGRLRLLFTGDKNSVCRLRDDVPVVSLLDADGKEIVRSTYTPQPEVVNPPAVSARYVGARSPVETGFTWTSSCAPSAASAALVGLTSEAIPVALTGAAPGCDGDTSAPRLGRFGGEGVAPADRKGLEVRLLPLQDTPAAGSVVTMVAEVANPTREPISLSPCPMWLLEQSEEVGSGDGLRGMSGGRSMRMPCDRLPGQVASGAAVRFEVQDRMGAGTPDIRGVQQVDLRFGIAGTEAWEGSMSVNHGTPSDPVATVPWKDTPKPPGEASTEPPAIGTKLPLASLHPTIEGLPESVRPGDILRYWVRVTNMATGGDGVSFDPCPGFVQTLYLEKSKRQINDEHYVNCEAAPATIEPGTSIRLDMELEIPDDAAPGTAGLNWKLGKMDFTGSESARTSILIR